MPWFKRKDEKIKEESAFIDLLTMEINKKIIGHYETTPFTYRFKRGQIFKHKFI